MSAFIESADARQLRLLGIPDVGHRIWDEEEVRARYPKAVFPADVMSVTQCRD